MYIYIYTYTHTEKDIQKEGESEREEDWKKSVRRPPGHATRATIYYIMLYDIIK